MSAAVNIKNLSYSYGTFPVLKNISFDVKKSDFFVDVSDNNITQNKDLIFTGGDPVFFHEILGKGFTSF